MFSRQHMRVMVTMLNEWTLEEAVNTSVSRKRRTVHAVAAQ